MLFAVYDCRPLFVLSPSLQGLKARVLLEEMAPSGEEKERATFPRLLFAPLSPLSESQHAMTLSSLATIRKKLFIFFQAILSRLSLKTRASNWSLVTFGFEEISSEVA